MKGNKIVRIVHSSICQALTSTAKDFKLYWWGLLPLFLKHLTISL